MNFTQQELMKLYRNMERGRRFNEAIVELCKMAEVPRRWSSGVGMEAIEAGAASFLKREDWVWSTQRSITACLAKGLDPKIWLRNNLSRTRNHHIRNNHNAFTAKHDANSPVGRKDPSSHLENLNSYQSVGVNGNGGVIVYLFGDSSVRPSELIEWIKESCKGKLPIVWIYINQPGSPLFTSADIGSCISKEVSSNGHGLLEMSVNGRDAVAIARTVQYAVEHARNSRGPSLIKAKLARTNGYPSRSIVKQITSENDRNRDPISELRDGLLKRRVATVHELRALEADIAIEVSAAFEWACKKFVH